MRTYLITGPRGEYRTRVTVSGWDEDEIDIARALLLVCDAEEWDVNPSIEPQEDDDAPPEE